MKAKSFDRRGFFAPHRSCSGPENVVRHAQAGCCVTDTRCVPATPSCPPLPAGPADATGSPVWRWPPTGKYDTHLYPSAQFWQSTDLEQTKGTAAFVKKNRKGETSVSATVPAVHCRWQQQKTWPWEGWKFLFFWHSEVCANVNEERWNTEPVQTWY